MDRRRMLVLAVAVGAGVSLLLLGRPSGDPDPAETTAGRPAPPAPSPAHPPADTPPHPPADTERGTPAGAPDLPHEASGVTGEESLATAEADAALAVAQQFAEVWAAPGPGWYDRVSALSTSALAAALADADPPAPARELTGGARMLLDAPSWARVGVPAQQGTLVLDVVDDGDQWLVAAVDWWPA